MGAIPCWQIDAFAERPFTGNPAAVCVLDREPDPRWMQAVAAEMNLSETAFVRPVGEGYSLRWFTPTSEVDLCGHATLASAHALFSAGMHPLAEPIEFLTLSGRLVCRSEGDLIAMDFPATPPRPEAPGAELLHALGIEPLYAAKTRFDWFFVLEEARLVRALEPDFATLARAGVRGVIVTSRSDDPRYDFISRFFAPGVGVDEDPVTGSAHCALAPYWCGVLGATELAGYQASARGGVVRVGLAGDRVILRGKAATVFRGELVAAW